MARKPNDPPLTSRQLRAIFEALTARLSGAIEDVDDLEASDYEAALGWAVKRMVRDRLRERGRPVEGE